MYFPVVEDDASCLRVLNPEFAGSISYRFVIFDHRIDEFFPSLDD